MKSPSALGICALALGSVTRVVCAADATPPQAPAIVLKAAHLFDAVSGKLTDHGVVVVQGKKIVAVGERAAATPGDSQVIELGDATLLPGFIDAHVHLQYDFTGLRKGGPGKRDERV